VLQNILRRLKIMEFQTRYRSQPGGELLLFCAGAEDVSNVLQRECQIANVSPFPLVGGVEPMVDDVDIGMSLHRDEVVDMAIILIICGLDRLLQEFLSEVQTRICPLFQEGNPC